MWKVTPLKCGSRKLFLNVYVVIESPDGKDTWDKSCVMSKTIDVNVSWQFRLKNLINTDIELQWIVGAIIIPLVLFLFRYMRRE